MAVLPLKSHPEPLHDCPRLGDALHALAAPPTDGGWNRSELHDLIPDDAVLVEAAVLVGLVPRAGGTRVILTRRTDALRHHAGQVSFPGGRLEADDADAVAAAVREAGEEIGLLPTQVAPLGFLDPLATITGFRVMPVVAIVDARFEPVPDPNEVADVFEVPLSFLLDPRNLASHVLDYRGRPREVHEYRYPAQRIWGATASMLLNLRTRLEAIR